MKNLLIYGVLPIAAINGVAALDPIEDIEKIGSLLIQLAIGIYSIIQLFRKNKQNNG